MDKEFDLLIKKYVKEGYDLDSIQESFFKNLIKQTNKKRNTKPKTKPKTKKNRKKICRPVILISDSSCDEFENVKRNE